MLTSEPASEQALPVHMRILNSNLLGAPCLMQTLGLDAMQPLLPFSAHEL